LTGCKATATQKRVIFALRRSEPWKFDYVSGRD